VARRLQVLFLTQRLPYAPNRGDRLRAYHELRILRESADVHVVALTHSLEEESHAGGMAGLAASVSTARVAPLRNYLRGAARLGTDVPLTFSLLDSPHIRPRIAEAVARHAPDVVLGYCSSMARFAFVPALASLPLVIDMVDADSAKWQSMVETRRGPLSWIYAREARCLRAEERRQMDRAFATVCVNNREAALLREVNPSARVLPVPVGVDLESYQPTAPPALDNQVVFTGTMNYEPNVEGAVWFVGEVWPAVRAKVPGARLKIVGADPVWAVRVLQDEAAGIEVTGRVPDVRPYLWSSALAVAPLLAARGVQTKVFEAVSAGLPVVVTPAVARGLPPEVTPACRVGEDAEAFAAQVVALLLEPPGGRRALAGLASLVSLSWEEQLKDLPVLLREAAASAVTFP
jgi:sugar transferase (PEP-CTERM/EpsH1 system associated)